MRHSPKQYAQALLEALKDKPEREHKEIMKNFLVILAKNGDRSKLSSIIRDMEKGYLKEAGLKKVIIESPQPVSSKTKKEVEGILGKNIMVFEKINPELLAGIKILIDDTTLIDASAQSRINKIFNK